MKLYEPTLAPALREAVTALLNIRDNTTDEAAANTCTLSLEEIGDITGEEPDFSDLLGTSTPRLFGEDYKSETFRGLNPVEAVRRLMANAGMEIDPDSFDLCQSLTDGQELDFAGPVVTWADMVRLIHQLEIAHGLRVIHNNLVCHLIPAKP